MTKTFVDDFNWIDLEAAKKYPARPVHIPHARELPASIMLHTRRGNFFRMEHKNGKAAYSIMSRGDVESFCEANGYRVAGMLAGFADDDTDEGRTREM